MNLRLGTLFLALALIAACLGVFRAAWEADATNHDLLLGTYLLLVTIAVVASAQRDARFRAGFLGVAVFGALYLVCILQGGFGLQTIFDSRALAKNTKLGFALLGVAFLATELITSMVRPPAARPSQNSDG